MSLDITRLEKVKNKGSNIIARCPACAEESADRKGQHLFITPEGKFGCVLNPGTEGSQHRKRIFELAGIKETPKGHYPQVIASTKRKRFMTVNKPKVDSAHQVIQSGVLGRLGHQSATSYLTKSETPVITNSSQSIKNSATTVPSVPTGPTNGQFDYLIEGGWNSI